MSESSKAVFLSYASQDAEAAKRICDALRAAGVEVWFDAEGGLEHGDEWDAKIRRQIKECVLFLPLISANTQAREEGYFRIEWDLAAERARGIASGVAFILPVVIDDTREPDALVPDRFRTVQWTRLKGGEVPPEVLQRFIKLWSHRSGVLAHVAARADSPATQPANEAQPVAGKPRVKSRALLGTATLVLVTATIGGWFLAKRSSLPTPPAGSASATKVPNETQKLVVQVRALFENPNYTRDDLALAEDLCKQALQRDSSNAEIWAIYAELSGEFIGGGTDLSLERREAARMQAERAVKLAPDSREASFAKASVLRRLGGTARIEAEKILRGMLAQTPDDPRVIIALAKTRWGNVGPVQDPERAGEVLALYDRAAGFPATRAQALRERGWVLWSMGRRAEAEAAIDAALALQSSKSASSLKVRLSLERGDIEAARKSLAALPEDVMRGDQGAALANSVWLHSRNPARCLDVLNPITRDYLSSNMFTGPTELLRGLAYHMDGKKQAALNAWHSALQVVDKRLAFQARDEDDLYTRAYLLALLGEREAAATALRLYEEVSGTAPGEDIDDVIVRVLFDSPERVLAMLAKLLNASPPQVTVARLRLAPEFDPLREDPRFQALLTAADTPAAPSSATPTLAPSNSAAVDAKSIAVLPFANLSEDKDSGYFADGVQEDVLTNLAKISQLKVIARTSVMEYRDTKKKIQQIAQELGVAYLLEGSVRRAGNRVRVVCQLIDGRTGQHVLAPDPFDRDLADIFAIQSEIAQGIAAKLQAVLAPTEKATLERAPTANLAAYELYLQARQFWGRSPDQRDGEEQARPLLERAVQLDPSFASAWQGLGFLHLRAYYRYDQSEARRLLAKQAIEKARELKPGDGEALALQTNYYIDVRDLPRARELAARLERDHPSLAITWHVLARLSIRDDNIRAALEYYRRARSLDPRNVAVLESLTGSLVTARRYEEAQAVLRDAGDLVEKSTQLLWTRTILPYYATGSTREMDELAARLTPDAVRGDTRALSLLAGFASIRGDAAELVRLWERHGSIVTVWGGDGTFTVALALLIQGQTERARILLEPERIRYRERLASRPDNIDNWFYLAATHAVLGDKEGTAAVKREMLAANPGLTRRGLWRYEECMLLAWLGDKDAALADLADRLAQGPAPAAITVLRHGLRFRPLQGDPRFEAMLADPKNSAPFF